MAAATNLVKLLAQREVNGCLERETKKRLHFCPRRVSLSHIIDREERIAQGHVLLGFSRCGHYLISYLCEVSLAPPTSFYRYSLHWWYFDLYKRLRLVSSYELFRDELIKSELQLIICQSLDGKYVIVLGCSSRDKGEEQRVCSVTILPRPPHPPGSMPTPSHSLSVHFKFDILSPFPSFVPSLCLRIPGTLLLNTVDSLVAVKYHCSFDGSCQDLTRDDVRLSAATPTGHTPSTRNNEIVFSPSQVLQVEVYREDMPLPPGPSPQSEVVDQSRLDVEPWINNVLKVELKKQSLDYCSLLDYDLQIYEVDGETGDVKFLMVVLLEASKSAKSAVSSYTTDVLGVWNVFKSRAELIHMFDCDPALPMVTINWQRTVHLALQLRRTCFLPRSRHSTVRAFSNHNVYTGGRSLEVLRHPYLPLQLVLTTSARKPASNTPRLS